MSACPKFHGFCDSFGAVQCGGDCAKCKDRNLAKAMTLGEWESNYRAFVAETHAVRPNTMRGNIYNLHRIMTSLKLTANDSMVKIDKSSIQTFYYSQEDLAPVSRKSIVESLRKMTSEKFVEWASSRGLVVSPMPSSKGMSGAYERYKQISNESMRAIRDLQWRYRQLDDPRKWLVLTLALDFGMSKADAVRAKWSDLFVRENGVTLVSYCRNKTGKRAMWRVSDELVREFRRAEELARRVRVNGVKRGETVESVLRVKDAGKDKNVTCKAWNDVNDELRTVIPEWRDTDKALHNCRKEFATYVCRNYGWEVGEIATGDTSKILQRSYVGKLVVDWRNIK